MRFTVGLVLLIACTAPVGAVAPLAAQSDSVTVVPSPQYAPRSSLHETILGSRYRDLWTTPISVPLLDLSSFAGGLTPVRTGGNVQTQALRFASLDGVEFNFRSVDKELTPAMPDFAKETFADWVRQDQTSSQLPAAPVVAAQLLDAVGVLNPGPRLVVMPDDPGLGEFREDYAGMLGTIEVHPDEGPDDDAPLFHDAEVVAGTERLLEHLREDPDDRVDSRAFLKARLMDVFMGDWDRHEGQWRWARYDREDGLRWWVAVPEDRDYAFVDYDGFGLELTRRFGIIRMVDFGEGYPELLAMVDNSLSLTKRFVGDLPYESWDSTAREIQAALTDEVIESAVRRMPAEHFALIGPELTRTLQNRRDDLHEAARRFFLLLNEAAEVHGSEHGDELRVQRHSGGAVEVTLSIAGDTTYPPRFQRTFLPHETDEVRIYLYDGDDRAVVEGAGGNMTVRVIGGEGDDHLTDLSAGPTAFYDTEGDNTLIRGRDTVIQRRPWIGSVANRASSEEGEGDEDEVEDEPLLPRLPLDWGERYSPFTPAIGWRGAAELVVGGGPTYTGYGFRRQPYARRVELTALYAPLHTRFSVQGRAELRRENSTAWIELLALASQMEATLFRGFGNDSPAISADASRVWRDLATVRGALHLDRWGPWTAHVGAMAEYVDPHPEEGTPAAALGSTDIRRSRRIGADAGLRLDMRDDPIFPRSGYRAELTAFAYPPLGDVAEPTGRADLLTAAYLPLPIASTSVLAIRAGGSSTFGDYPFYDAAFIGGSRSLRGYGFERFAGDQALFGTAEIRTPLTEANIVVRGELGASLFADAGRVYVDGDSPGGWHSAAGGSVWFAVPIGVATLSYARGEEDRLYLHLGVPF